MLIAAQAFFTLSMLASLASGFSARLASAVAWAATAIFLLVGALAFALLSIY